MTPQELTGRFREVFGRAEGLRLFRAPGRVNIIGEHVDYNGGHVLPCGLAMGTWALASPRAGARCRLFSTNLPDEGMVEFDLHDPWDPDEKGWSRYPRAVLTILAARGARLSSGLDVLYHGTIPAGAGLSSSASLEVVTGYAFMAASNLEIDLKELALAARAAENELVGVNCGIMDQFAAALSRKDRAMLLDCQSLAYSYPELALPGARLVITDSRETHALSGSKYNERFGECRSALAALGARLPVGSLCELDPATFEANKDLLTDPVLYRRARHVVSENHRVLSAAAALERGDLAALGRLMTISHASMRDDFEISTPRMDALVEAALSVEGVYGSRMTGGGFGGCTVTLVRESALEELTGRLGRLERFGNAPVIHPTRTGGGVSEFPISDAGEDS
jgi:galactokinase